MLKSLSQVLLMIPPPSLLMGTVATATLTGLLLLPFLIFATVGVVSALVCELGRALTLLILFTAQIASQNPGNVYIRLFYCFLDRQDM